MEIVSFIRGSLGGFNALMGRQNLENWIMEISEASVIKLSYPRLCAIDSESAVERRYLFRVKCRYWTRQETPICHGNCVFPKGIEGSAKAQGLDTIATLAVDHV